MVQWISSAFKVYIFGCLMPQLWNAAVVVMDNLPAHKVKAIAPTNSIKGAIAFGSVSVLSI